MKEKNEDDFDIDENVIAKLALVTGKQITSKQSFLNAFPDVCKFILAFVNEWNKYELKIIDSEITIQTSFKNNDSEIYIESDKLLMNGAAISIVSIDDFNQSLQNLFLQYRIQRFLMLKKIPCEIASISLTGHGDYVYIIPPINSFKDNRELGAWVDMASGLQYYPFLIDVSLYMQDTDGEKTFNCAEFLNDFIKGKFNNWENISLKQFAQQDHSSVGNIKCSVLLKKEHQYFQYVAKSLKDVPKEQILLLNETQRWDSLMIKALKKESTKGFGLFDKKHLATTDIHYRFANANQMN